MDNFHFFFQWVLLLAQCLLSEQYSTLPFYHFRRYFLWGLWILNLLHLLVWFTDMSIIYYESGGGGAASDQLSEWRRTSVCRECNDVSGFYCPSRDKAKRSIKMICLFLLVLLVKAMKDDGPPVRELWGAMNFFFLSFFWIINVTMVCRQKEKCFIYASVLFWGHLYG